MARLRGPLFFLAIGYFAVAWIVCEWPPPDLLLKHGLTPGARLTGQERRVGDLVFVEVAHGCFLMGSHIECRNQGNLAAFSRLVGLDTGEGDVHDGPECPRHWVEIREAFWITKDRLPKRLDWMEAARYARRLGERHDCEIRLPSEAQWEYLARAGLLDGDGREWCADRWFGSYRDGPDDERPRTGKRTGSTTFLRVVRSPNARPAWRDAGVSQEYPFRLVATFAGE